MFNFNLPFFLEDLQWKDFVDIFVVFLIVYHFYKTVSKTRALPVLQGLGFILVILLLAAYFGMDTLKSILERVVGPMLLSIIILFPSEIRRALYVIGKRTFFLKKILKQDERDKAILLESVNYLSKEKIGALIVIQRNDSLHGIIETGTTLNANLNTNLMLAIFQKGSPLHDGAVVVSQNQITAAACYITNLSSSLEISTRYGTRHRAGLGLSESTDAIAIITSEEKGTIACTCDSQFFGDIDIKKLDELLNQYLYKQDEKGRKNLVEGAKATNLKGAS